MYLDWTKLTLPELKAIARALSLPESIQRRATKAEVASAIEWYVSKRQG